MLIHEFISVESSSRKNQKERRIEELKDKLQRGDTLIVAELSRLGRNMLETLNVINELSENGISIVFVRQPELSTLGPHTKLLLAIYSYFAESEREYISMRTKQGLAAAKASGKQLGRPKGVRNKHHVLDPFKVQIMQYLSMRLNLAAILKIVNHQLTKPVTYQALKYHVKHDSELARIRKEKVAQEL
jgi:DNA invertase Pin-like site-specific DNA recombinase